MDLDAYLKRFNGRPPLIKKKPSSNLNGVIVIPCFREADWEPTFKSLVDCDAPSRGIEVITVLNDSEADTPEIHSFHRDTLISMSKWSQDHETTNLKFHVVNALQLPQKHAGVGLARKIGMDEALHRLNQSKNLQNGWIAGLDADCLCQPNYLEALITHFQQNKNTPGCSIYFEHPIEGPLEQAIYQTAAKYELHLRYYIEALRYAGFPHAYQTIGSAMATTAQAYISQGGMNRRKAGEDFYFLNKIISLGNFTELNSTTVIPSPRTSDRVPFGTGRAVAKHLKTPKFPTYSWTSIEALKQFFTTVQSHDPFLNEQQRIQDLHPMPEIITKYIENHNGWKHWQACINGTNGFSAYIRRFFQWFNAFQCMKCLHFMRDHGHGEMDVGEACQYLGKSTAVFDLLDPHPNEMEMLHLLRNHQKKQ